MTHFTVRPLHAVLLVAAGLLTACQTTRASSPGPGLVEVCDSQGCRVQDAQAQTYDPSTAVPDPDPNGLLPVLIPEAEADPDAAYRLARRYVEGDGIRRNAWEGLKWLRDAAERGHLRAQRELGEIYLNGFEETGPDYIEAERWLKTAADRGDAQAQEMLAELERRRNPAYADGGGGASLGLIVLMGLVMGLADPGYGGAYAGGYGSGGGSDFPGTERVDDPLGAMMHQRGYSGHD